jgi:hypothetical protein
MPKRLEVFVVYHDPQTLAGLDDKPFLIRRWLDDLPAGRYSHNSLAESRAYLADLPYQADAEYVGLATARWNKKYPRILGLQDLDKLDLQPNLVYAAEKTKPGWVGWSDECHPGMRRLIYEMAGLWDLPVECRSSVWANNFICHRSVMHDLMPFWRRTFDFMYQKYGLDPPFVTEKEAYSRYKQHLHPAYLYERITTLYFTNRTDLKVVQIPSAESLDETHHPLGVGLRHPRV